MDEYEHIKKRAYYREDWRYWRPGPASKGRALNRERYTTTRPLRKTVANKFALFFFTTKSDP